MKRLSRFVSCKACQLQIRESEQVSHQAVCRARLVTCERCGKTLNAREYAINHLVDCGPLPKPLESKTLARNSRRKGRKESASSSGFQA